VAESATQQHLTALDRIEVDLRHEVERASAEFHSSLNGNREAAAGQFEKALKIFNDFLLNHQVPKS
jgi:hypothetical protein